MKNLFFVKSPNLAAYLLVNGVKPEGIHKNKGIPTFYYDRNEKLYEVLEQYNQDKKLKEFLGAYKKIKEMTKSI